MEAEAVSGLVRITGESLQASIKVVAANAEVIKKLLAFIYAAFTSSSEVGKRNISSLLKQGKPLEMLRLSEESYKRFAKLAKKYGVAFSAVKNKKDTMVDLIIKQENVERLMQIFEANRIPYIQEENKKGSDKEKININSVAEVSNENTAPECTLKWNDESISKLINNEFDMEKQSLAPEVKTVKPKILEKLEEKSKLLAGKGKEIAKGISLSNKGIEK